MYFWLFERGLFNACRKPALHFQRLFERNGSFARPNDLRFHRSYCRLVKSRAFLTSSSEVSGMIETPLRTKICFTASSERNNAKGRRNNSDSTYMSRHYHLPRGEIDSYLKRKGLVSRNSGAERLVVQNCPFCHPIKGKPDNQWKLYIKKQDGAFFCHRCGSHGSWLDFKRKNGDAHGFASTSNNFRSNTNSRGGFRNTDRSRSSRNSKPVLPKRKAWDACRELLSNSENSDALRYLQDERGLSTEVLRLYGVGCITANFIDASGNWKPKKCITFPWTDKAKNDNGNTDPPAFRMKLRGLEDKSNQRLDPAGGQWGFFGWHLVPEDATSLIICEGEFDAMSVFQATGQPAISLPNGCRSLPVDLLPRLEKFEEIVLWMDNDNPGQEGAQQFAEKLGKSRCLLVQPPPSMLNTPKDANEALKLGQDLQYFVDTARPLPHDQIVTFRELRSQIMNEINKPESVSGVPFTSLPTLQKLMRGHRRGEVTLMTGPTGAGKTTLLSQLSLDLCAQGVTTLWGSFEVKNTRLMQKMLHQFSGMGLAFGSGYTSTESRTLESMNDIAECFEDLPLYFLRFHGSTVVDEVIDAMEYAAYVYDVTHVVLDNLQFMLSGQGGRGFERFDAQEIALERLRQFATARNVHITLVMHPRKESAEARLSMNSIFGTAKATQEADNVFILQAVPQNAPTKYNQGSAFDADGDVALSKSLDVKKNRFDGRLGSIPLDFDDDTLLYIERGTTLSMEDSDSQILHQSRTHVEQKTDHVRTNNDSPRSEKSSSANGSGSSAQGSELTNHQKAEDASVFPVDSTEDITITPVQEEEAFSILTK